MTKLIFSTLLGASLALACSTTGTAMGELHTANSPKPEPVTFVWKADAETPERGSIAGNLPDGKHYAGRYYEVAENVPEQVYAGAWGGSEPYWPDWPVTSPRRADKANWDTFAATYTGRVIATLSPNTDGPTIRCRFNLNAPSAGLARGGSGECKLSDGETIQNVVVTR
ncbi:MAG TPA: hypothetical protein VMI54_12545 [Polyangiaceae bacterium]|nr:hypothetical protein [Polyangiaceae bacterium]